MWKVNLSTWHREKLSDTVFLVLRYCCFQSLNFWFRNADDFYCLKGVTFCLSTFTGLILDQKWGWLIDYCTKGLYNSFGLTELATTALFLRYDLLATAPQNVRGHDNCVGSTTQQNFGVATKKLKKEHKQKRFLSESKNWLTKCTKRAETWNSKRFLKKSTKCRDGWMNGGTGWQRTQTRRVHSTTLLHATIPT